MKSFFLLFIIFSQSTVAAPKNLEVWFLSIDKEAAFREFKPKLLEEGFVSKRIAQNTIQCQKVGDHCFDPQIGLYKKTEGKKAVDSTVDSSSVYKAPSYSYHKSDKKVDERIVDCDKRNKFDIYCGKSKKIATSKKVKVEVWIDTSSTMKQVDAKIGPNSCSRQLFLSMLDSSCGFNRGLKAYYFSAARKEAGTMKEACRTDGINNMKRIIENIKTNKSKNLIIVTDIFEASEKFIGAIKSLGGTIRGVDKPLYGRDLMAQGRRVRNLCL